MAEKKKTADQQFTCLREPWTDSSPAGTLDSHQDAIKKDFSDVKFEEEASGQVKAVVEGKVVAILNPVKAQ